MYIEVRDELRHEHQFYSHRSAFVMIDLYEKFIAAVENGSLTHAAEELKISQPAVSESIEKLERELGAQVLIRSQKGVTPTKVGEMVYEDAREVLRQVQCIRHKVARKARLVDNTIRMGMIDNVGMMLFGKLYSRFVQKYPEVQLHFHVHNSSVLIELVEGRKIDFAVITGQARELSRGIVSQEFAVEQLTLIARPDVARRIHSREAIQRVKFVSYNRSSTTHSLILKKLQQLGVQASFYAYSASPELIVQLVQNGMGVAFLPRNLISKQLESGKLAEVQLDNFIVERQLQLIHLEETYLSLQKRQFIGMLERVYEGR
ncbi:MAG: LysR family transcriptional regulator [Candidatus Dojkabacteria bacterium]